MSVVIGVLLLSFINVYGHTSLQHPEVPRETNCIISVISNSCESHGAVTIQNQYMCEKASDLFLGRELKSLQVHPKLQWHSPPGCHHNNFNSLFNTRTKVYYNNMGKLHKGQGQCSRHTPCIWGAKPETCPEEHKFRPNEHFEVVRKQLRNKKQNKKNTHKHHNLW